MGRTSTDRHVRVFQPFADAGFDEVYVGSDRRPEGESSSEKFFEAYAEKVLPRLRSAAG